MFEIGKKPLYKAFGLIVSSDIYLPELTATDEQMETIDVEIKVKDTRTSLYVELFDKPNEFVVNEEFIMFHISKFATFSIQEGKLITVSPMKEADEDMIRVFILGTCMGALLMQRKIYPLHGSAVAIDGKAYAIVGDSGAGKSTLASAFLSQGYQLLSDDVIAVSLSEDEYIPYVTPSYPQQKLWQDSLNHFGMDMSHYKSVYGRETKYSVPVASKYFPDPLPLAGIFELVKIDKKMVEIERIENLKRLHTLYLHTYRNFFISNMGLMDWHFKTSTDIVEKIDIFQLRRPVSGFSAPQLVSIILETLNGGINHDQKSKHFSA